MINIRKLEAELWESADLLRQGSKLTSNQYCMPVLGLIFLRYAFGRFKLVEAEILKDRPVRRGRVLPVEASDFAEKSALYLPPEARYDYLVNLPESADIGKAVNRAMELIEEQSEQLVGVLPKDYTMFTDEILSELLRIFTTVHWTKWVAISWAGSTNTSSINLPRTSHPTMACSSRPNLWLR